MNNLDRETKHLLRAEKFHKHLDPIWNSIPFGIKIFALCILLVVALVFVSNIRFRYTQRYASPEKLTEVFQKYEAEFETAKEELRRLKEHQISEDGNILICDADHWDPSSQGRGSRNIINRSYQTVWISSYVSFSESEYEQMYEAVAPLFRKLSLKNVLISSDRNQIFFTVYSDSASWGGHYDVVLYDATTETLEGEALNEYIDSFVMPRRPIDYAIIKAGWIAYSQKR